MVGIPFFGDQRHNCFRAYDHGYGIDMRSAVDFQVDDLVMAIREVLTNPDFRRKTRHASAILKSHSLNPRQIVAREIDHVIEFGGEHLRSAAYDLYWFQYFMLDVLGFLVLVVIAICYSGVLLWRLLIRACFKGQSQKVKLA